MKNLLLSYLLLLSPILMFSQAVGIGTTSPNEESSLDIATSLPMVLPSMIQSEIDALTSPEVGMIIYNTETDKLQLYSQTTESSLLEDPASIVEATGTGWFISKEIDNFYPESYALGQTYIPQLTGTLDQLSINMKIINQSGSDDQIIRVSVWRGAVVSGSPIATETFSVLNTSFTWYDIALSASPSVSTGETLVITCEYENPCTTTGFNRVSWLRNVNYLVYPPSYDAETNSCPATYSYTKLNSDNRYNFKGMIETTSKVGSWVDIYDGLDAADEQVGVTTAGTNITLTGMGTVGDPYVVNANELPQSPSNGEMNYWDGSAWVSVPAGTHGQSLNFCEGVPTWGPCPETCTDGIQNQGETDIDCGGPNCAACP